MAPEQARGEAVDARSDLFSLGCVLFRLAAGRLPFQGDTPLAVLHALANDTPPPLRQLDPTIPESFSLLVAALLERRPENRPASAHVVASALAAIELEEFSRQQGRDVKRKRGKSAALVAALVAALLTMTAVAAVTVLRTQTSHGDKGPPRDPRLAVLQTRIKAGGKNDVKEPADNLKRQDIPLELLARAGNGDPARAAPELVAVLGGPRHFVTPPTGMQCCTRFSPDGRVLATCAGKEIPLYDAASGQTLRRLVHPTVCTWFDFRADSKVLAVSCFGGIHLWDLDTGQSLGDLKSKAKTQPGVAFTQKGDSFVTCDADGKALVRDAATMKVVQTINPPEGHRFTQPPQIHPEGRLVALHASGPKPTVCVADLATGEMKGQVPGAGTVPHTPGVTYQCTVRFSPDGQLLAAVRDVGAVVLYDMPDLARVGEIAGGASILNFSADGSTLFRGHLWPGSNLQVCTDDVKTRTKKLRLTPPLAVDTTWSDLSPDGRTIAVRVAASTSIRLFDAATGQERSPPLGHSGPVTALAISPDGGAALSTSTDHRVLLWDLRSGQLLREIAFYRDAYYATQAAAFSPDGKWVAAQIRESSLPGWIHIWESATGKEVKKLPGKGRDWQRSDFAFLPQGESLITSAGTSLEKWTLPDGSPTTWQAAHDQPIETLAVHPDGAQVALGDKTGVIRLWNTPTAQQAREFRCEGRVLRIRFSPDGHMLAATTAAPDAALYMWDLQTGSKMRRSGHTDSVEGLAWRSDSQVLATAANDGTVRLWPRDLLAEPRTIQLHAGKQGQLAFTPAGRHLLTANEDGSVFMLRVAGS